MDQEGIELFAIWTPISYTIDFDGNTSDGGSDPGDQTVAFDASVTLSSNTFTKTDNDFLGWSLAAGGAVAYDDADTFTMTEALIPGTGTTITLYAQWGVLPVTITFNASTVDLEGNSNAGLVTGSMTPQVIEEGATDVPLAANEFEWDGWNFLGWSDPANISLTPPNFEDAEEVDFSDFSSDTTLYAVWEPDTLELTIDDVYVLDFPEDSDPGLVTHTFNPGDEVVAYNEVDEDNPEELVRGDISSGSATLEIQKIGELESDPDLADIADVDEINSSPVVFFVENTGAEVGGLYSANYDFDALTVKEQYIYFVDRATTLNGTLTEVEGPYFYTLDEVFDADGTTIGSETNFDYWVIDEYLVPYLEDKEGFDENEDAANYYQLVYDAATSFWQFRMTTPDVGRPAEAQPDRFRLSPGLLPPWSRGAGCVAHGRSLRPSRTSARGAEAGRAWPLS